MRSYSDLRPYQQRMIDNMYAYDQRQCVVPMGGGKTVSTLTAISELISNGEIRKAHVIAPKFVAAHVWPTELKQWDHLSNLSMAVSLGNPAERRAALFSDSNVIVSTIDNVQWTLQALTEAGISPNDPIYDMWVIDEISRIKNPRSKRLRALGKHTKAMRNRYGLTGTPRPNGYEDQFGPMRFITDGKLWGRSFDPWRMERMIPTDYNQHNWEMRDEWIPRTVEDIRQFTFAIQDDELPQLPPLSHIEVPVFLTSGLMKPYNEMLKTLVAELETGGSILAPNAAVATAKLEQISQGFLYPDETGTEVTPLHTLKIEALAELLASLDTISPTLVAYWYEEDKRAILKFFPDAIFLDRDTADREAAHVIDRWNRGELPVLFVHPASVGHGLNLQTGGSYIIWYTPVWSAELTDQMIKRLHRSGQTQPVFNYHLVAVGPNGERLVDNIKVDRAQGKISDQDAFRALLKGI